MPKSPADAGTAIGQKEARRCLDMRGKDGVGAANLYRPVTSPGKYVPTMLPVSFDWQKVTPWFLSSPSQFRPEAPPALTSATWARDYNEIKEIGGRTSTKRTEQQTETARFWSIVGVPSWNPVVRALASSQPRSLVENARLFAVVNMAASDAFVAVFDAKYAHQFWRPLTAIRNGDIVDAICIIFPIHRQRSEEISAWAIPILREEAIKAQSEKVDMVSQASFTTEGYQMSLASALTRAAKK